MSDFFQKVEIVSVGRKITAVFAPYGGENIEKATDGYLRRANGYFEFVPEGRYLSPKTLEIIGCAVCCVAVPIA